MIEPEPTVVSHGDQPLSFIGEDPRDRLPQTLAVIQKGMTANLHIGAQFYVARDGVAVADFGIGLGRPGVPLTPTTLVTWSSATKPATACCVLQLWERDIVDLDEPVATYIPEFGAHGKEGISVRHVMTHTSCFPRAVSEQESFSRQNAAHLDQIYSAKLEEGVEVGKTAIYHSFAGFILLAELVERCSGMPIEEYARRNVFLPLGMDNCWYAIPRDRQREYGDRLGLMHYTQSGEAVPQPAPEYFEDYNLIVNGAGSGRGPVRELARLYEMLRNDGELDGRRVLQSETVAAMTRNQRPGALTPKGEPASPWGLGITIDIAKRYHPASVSKSFGHGGYQSCLGCCDVDNALVLAISFNGCAGHAAHDARIAEVGQALYRDLALLD